MAAPSGQFSRCSDIHTLLRDKQKGMFGWSLPGQVDPSSSSSLIQVLVEELEKKLSRVKEVGKTRCYVHVVPVLHTLYYVIIQSGAMIPSCLYRSLYQSLMKLLILPEPYSAVALKTLRSIKMEMITPGCLYQRMVSAEQKLNNEFFPLQEKVFVLADPAVFSGPLEATIRASLETCSVPRNAGTLEENVVLGVLQRGLGASCQSSRLAPTLRALENQRVRKYFQEVSLAVELGVKQGSGGHSKYLNKLRELQSRILAEEVQEDETEADRGSVGDTTWPPPDISFHLWKDEEKLRYLLTSFALSCCSNSSVDDEALDKRDSAQSEGDGTKRDEAETPPPPPPPGRHLPLSRQKAFKNVKLEEKRRLKEKTDAAPRSCGAIREARGRHVAKVVVMGDDRVLGRLARAYRSIREKDQKRLYLTKKLNLQFFYVPVEAPSSPSVRSAEAPRDDEGQRYLASMLGKVDVWYDSNINSLQTGISKLVAMQRSGSSKAPLGSAVLLDTLCYYLRCATQPLNLPLYSVKMTRSGPDVSSVVEEVFVSHLEAEIPEFRQVKEMFLKEQKSSKKKTTVDPLGAFISVSYTKVSPSKREAVKGESVMTCGVVMTSDPAAVTSGEDSLSVRFDSVNPGNNASIRTQSISLRTMEHRTLSVRLDKDDRRTYTDVQRLDVSLCLDPGSSIRTRFSSSSERQPTFKVLSLPINTFTGVTT
ncbi:uncharacterized protein V6R79_012591 [Siganus canaliculatus]